MDYLDVDLEIEPIAGRDYRVIVRSLAGEARATMRFPFDELALEKHLHKLQLALVRSDGLRRRVLTDEEQAVQDFGRSLFDALIAGDVRALYDVSRSRAAQEGRLGIRLRLRILDAALAALPWEYLYDARQSAYLCLSRSTPLVRYPEIAQPIQPLKVEPPLRILAMIASPNSPATPKLDVEREKDRMREALKDLDAAGLVEVTWLPGQTWRHLQRAMRSGPWHIFHFIGHGGFDPSSGEGVLALADDAGKLSLLSATQLGYLLANHSALRLALLNACEGAKGDSRDLFSSTAATLARHGIPAVLAMQYEITDRAAIECTRAFYESLADGLPVDAALAEARAAIHIGVNNSLEWGTPVLYLHATDGLLFDVTRKPDRDRTEQPTALTLPTDALPPVTPKEHLPRSAGRDSPDGQGRTKETLAAISQTSAWLMIEEQRVLLSKPHTSIGRSPRNDVVIADDQQISGAHALILFDGTNFMIQDVGSTNGTFLNIARVTSPMVLHNGDRIRLGQHELVFLTAEVPMTPPDATLVTPSGAPPPVRPFLPPVGIQPPHSEGWQKRIEGMDQQRQRTHEAIGSILINYSGHSQPVHRFAWSPDGRHLASTSADKTVHIWEAMTGQKILIYTDHLNELGVTDVAWSPDGTRIASSSSKGVRVWEVATKRTLNVYHGHTGTVYAVTWSPDSIRIASAGDDGIHTWFPDARQPGSPLTYQDHPLGVRVVAWSPDGNRIASAGGRKVHIWDASKGELGLSYRSHAKQIAEVAWSPDGQLLASCGDKAVQVRQATSGGHIVTYKGHSGLTSALTWSPGGKYIASVGGETIQIWEALTGKRLSIGGDPTSPILTGRLVKWSPQGPYIASTSQDGIVQIWRGIE